MNHSKSDEDNFWQPLKTNSFEMSPSKIQKYQRKENNESQSLFKMPPSRNDISYFKTKVPN